MREEYAILMRLAVLLRVGLLTAVTLISACDRLKPKTEAASAPVRKAGFWRESLMRDGKPGRLGGLTVCVDTQTESQFSALGRHFNTGACKRTINRESPTVIRFTAVCARGDGATVTTQGMAQGDFNAAYTVRSDVNVQGAPIDALNGDHELVMTGQYLGACPAGVKPGDVVLGSGVKVNIARLPQIIQGLSGG